MVSAVDDYLFPRLWPAGYQSVTHSVAFEFTLGCVFAQSPVDALNFAQAYGLLDADMHAQLRLDAQLAHRALARWRMIPRLGPHLVPGAQPVPGTVISERTGRRVRLTDPWAYPVRAMCSCGLPIRAESVYLLEWEHLR